MGHPFTVLCEGFGLWHMGTGQEKWPGLQPREEEEEVRGVDTVRGRKGKTRGSDTIGAESQSCCSSPGFGIHPSHRPAGVFSLLSAEMLPLPVPLPAVAVRSSGGLSPVPPQAK